MCFFLLLVFSYHSSATILFLALKLNPLNPLCSRKREIVRKRCRGKRERNGRLVSEILLSFSSVNIISVASAIQYASVV
jgi:hypothetical protein